VATKVLLFPELCHACGGCRHVCPEEAIDEVPRDVGRLDAGRAGDVQFVQGTLNVGEAKSPPVIKAAREAAPDAELVFFDAPPGTSCPVVESIRGCDFVLLVTEPTPFGLNDLKLAVGMVRALNLPAGVVINRADLDRRMIHRYCREEWLKVLGEIPDDRRIAEAYSNGKLISEALPDYVPLFKEMLEGIAEEAAISSGEAANA
jgi:MinD superfamily P-loop ATPase